MPAATMVGDVDGDLHWQRMTPLEQLMLLETGADNPVFITAVISLSSNPSASWACSQFSPRLLSHPRFRSRVRTTATRSYRYELMPDYVVGSPTLNRHFESVSPPLPTDVPYEKRYAEFTVRMNDIVSERLPSDRPMWKFYIFHNFSVVDGAGDGIGPADEPSRECSTVVMRVHHSIADGIGLVKYFISQLIDDVAGRPISLLVAPKRKNVATASNGSDNAVTDSVGAATLPGKPSLGERLRDCVDTTLLVVNDIFQTTIGPLFPDRRNTFNRTPIQKRKVCAIIPPTAFTVAQVKAAGHRLGVTINDLLFAAVSGATSAYLQEAGDDIAALDVIRCGIPINRHMLDEFSPDDVCNQLTILPVPMPVSPALSRIARLDACVATMRKLKRGVRPQSAIAMLSLVSAMPLCVRYPLWKHLTRCSSLIFTNVPGPREAVTVCGVKVEGMYFFAPADGHSGVCISLFSYNGSICMGVQADANRVKDPHRFADLLQSETEAFLQLERE